MSVTVMAHPRRREWAVDLADRLDATVTWDRVNDRHETGLRCLQAADRSDRWHLIVQDDALVAEGLVDAVGRAMQVAGDRIVCLYVGMLRPKRLLASAAVEQARERGMSWLAGPGPWWGVGLVIPTAHVDRIVDAYAASTWKNYDRRLEKVADQLDVECWYTVPSLVDHRTDGNPSLCRRDNGRWRADRERRRAHWFAEDATGLSFDGGVLHMGVEGDGMQTFRNRHSGRIVTVDDVQAAELARMDRWQKVRPAKKPDDGLDGLTVLQLRDRCRQQGVPTSGSKAQLLARLREV